ncbi:iron-sulfur cluster assembly scaffold protein [Candidatus Woesearchaeota archaeon]|nr:iron-sulfur cluster assembly scaffold protein [Candidatus Woesearchaeota archaeon]
MYKNSALIQRFRFPQFAGEMEDADAIGEVGNFKCGDIMKIFIKVQDNIITDITFQTYGCVAAISSTDMVCEMAKGMTLDEAEKLTSKDVVEKLGEVPEVKVHCSILGTNALREAIKNYRAQQTKND